jgi:hypothetical protein
MVTWLAVGSRALRTNRSAHERREWARCERERITSALNGEAVAGALNLPRSVGVAPVAYKHVGVLSGSNPA